MGSGCGELSRSNPRAAGGKASGTGGKNGPPAVSPKLLRVTPSARGPTRRTPRLAAAQLATPSRGRRPLRGCGERRQPRHPKVSPRPSRSAPLSASAEPEPRARRGQGISPSFLRLALHPLARRRSSLLSPLTARRHFPRSSALKSETHVAPQPAATAAAAAAAAAATDSAAAAPPSL